MKPTDKMTDTQELVPDELVRAQDAATLAAYADGHFDGYKFGCAGERERCADTIAARDAEIERHKAVADAEIERHKAVADAAQAFIQAHWRAVGVGSAKMADRVADADIAAAARAAAAAFQRLDSALTQWKETP